MICPYFTNSGKDLEDCPVNPKYEFENCEYYQIKRKIEKLWRGFND